MTEPSMWTNCMVVGIEGRGDYRPYTIGNFNLTQPKADSDELSNALSNNKTTVDQPSDRYAGNLFFGMNFRHGRCLQYEPYVEQSIIAKFGTDVALQSETSLKTTQKIVKPHFAISSQTSLRLQAGMNIVEHVQRQREDRSTAIAYEADLKTGPLFRFNTSNRNNYSIVEVTPYVGAGIKGKTVNNNQTKVDAQALVGAKADVYILEHNHKDIGWKLFADINNVEGKVGVAHTF